MIDSKLFQWRDDTGVCSLRVLEDAGHAMQGRFPKELIIRSRRTGGVRLFLTDRADMEAKEFYDGEQHTYISEDGVRIAIYRGA